LVDALDSRDEDLRTLAGMFLTEAGKKAEPLLEEALAKREHFLWCSPLSGISVIRNTNPRCAASATTAIPRSLMPRAARCAFQAQSGGK